jgi:hypothetical protein
MTDFEFSALQKKENRARRTRLRFALNCNLISFPVYVLLPIM